MTAAHEDWRAINAERLAFIPQVSKACRAKNIALRRFEGQPSEGNAEAYSTAKGEADAAEARLRDLHGRFTAAHDRAHGVRVTEEADG